VVNFGAEGPDSAVIGDLTGITYTHHDFLGLADRNDFYVFYVTQRSLMTFNLTNASSNVAINLNLGGLPYHQGTSPANPLTLPTPDPIVSDIGPYNDIQAGGGSRTFSAILDPGVYDLRAYTDTSFADPSGTLGYASPNGTLGNACNLVYPKNGGAFYDLTITARNAGTSALNGTSGNDKLFGSNGNDTLFGGLGNDQLNGGVGADAMAGGGGNDIYLVDNVGDVVTEAASAGTDTVQTTLASYTLGANVENLTFTGAANFTGTGNTLNNVITGGIGNDKLNGGGGNDTLKGGAGNDTLNGGTGNDKLTGGSGKDSFLFNTALSATTNVDHIFDFSSVNDKILLRHSVFTAAGALGTLAAGAFHTGSGAADADDRIVYSSATGALIYDSNGNVAGGATQFATLSTGLALTHSNFTIV
jgi:serralysin